MKIIIESTSKTVTLETPGGGFIPARIWEGHTESGVPVHCYITRLAAPLGSDMAEFEAELQSHRAPLNPDIDAIPNRLIL